MKNKLLITTALVALVSAGNAYAEITRNNAEEITLIKDESKTSAIVHVANETEQIVAENAQIIGNENTKGGVGGVFYVEKSAGKLTVKNGALFQNNTSIYDGGAIGNYGSLSIEGATFDSNHAQTSESKQDGNPIGGGAISLGIDSVTDININKSIFTNNDSGYNGGAIATRTTLQKGETGARNSLSISNSIFTANKANGGVQDTSYNQGTGGNGGAIANTFGTTSIKSTEFNKNEAKNYGGAIYNAKYLDVVTNKMSENYGGKITLADTSFTGNTAGEHGGAVYNAEGTVLTLTGKNTFSGNRAGNDLNDIHNIGNITVSGDLSLDGGISGAGTTTFTEGSSLTVNTGTTQISNNVVNQGATLNLKFDNGYTGEYALVTNGGSLDEEFEIAENNLYNIISSSNGTYDVSKKSTAEITAATGANTNQASVISAVTSGNSSNAVFNKAAEGINNLLQSSDKADVQAGLNAVTALAPEVAPMVQQTQSETATQVFGAVGTRLSGGSISTGGEGMSSGDSIFKRGAMWVQGMFNKSKLDDTSKAKGFEADSNGVAFGAEKYINDDVKAGIGYAYTKADIDGFMRSTDVDTHTAIVYGEYKPSNWYVNGIATYGWSDYSEDKNVAGVGVKADYDVETFGLQAMTGYDMQVKGSGFTPEAGLRYVHIKQDAYKDSADQRVSANDSDILTGVIGAKVSKNFELSNGMNIKPEARIAATYDLMNDDVKSVVTLANGSAYSVDGEALDRFGMEFGAGVTAEVNNNVELSLGYEGKFREDYQDHTGLLNAKYKF